MLEGTFGPLAAGSRLRLTVDGLGERIPATVLRATATACHVKFNFSETEQAAFCQRFAEAARGLLPVSQAA